MAITKSSITMTSRFNQNAFHRNTNGTQVCRNSSSCEWGKTRHLFLFSNCSCCVCPGYGHSFDSYNGLNNYGFGNCMFDERVREERGARGNVFLTSLKKCCSQTLNHSWLDCDCFLCGVGGKKVIWVFCFVFVFFWTNDRIESTALFSNCK